MLSVQTCQIMVPTIASYSRSHKCPGEYPSQKVASAVAKKKKKMSVSKYFSSLFQGLHQLPGTWSHSSMTQLSSCSGCLPVIQEAERTSLTTYCASAVVGVTAAVL